MSIILPVRGRSEQLRDRVQRWIDLATDWTDRFELLVVDCGGDDTVIDVAFQLADTVPQAHYLPRTCCREVLEGIEAAAMRCVGELIFVDDLETPWSTFAISQLWAQRDDQQLISATAPAPSRGVRMLRRQRLCLPVDEQPDVGDGAVASPAPLERFTRTDLSRQHADHSRAPNVVERLRRLTNS